MGQLLKMDNKKDTQFPGCLFVHFLFKNNIPVFNHLCDFVRIIEEQFPNLPEEFLHR